MKTLSEYIDRPLRLIRKSIFRFEYELVAGEETLATFNYRISFGFSGKVKGFDKTNIVFYKEKFWSWEVLIKEEGKEIPFAKYKRIFGIRSGNVDLPMGNKIHIHFGFFNIATDIVDDNGMVLATLKRSNIFTRKMNLLIKQKSKLLDENPWLVFLALYIIIKRRQRRR